MPKKKKTTTTKQFTIAGKKVQVRLKKGVTKMTPAQMKAAEAYDAKHKLKTAAGCTLFFRGKSAEQRCDGNRAKRKAHKVCVRIKNNKNKGKCKPDTKLSVWSTRGGEVVGAQGGMRKAAKKRWAKMKKSGTLCLRKTSRKKKSPVRFSTRCN